jgi:LPS sulfotransferase NodH
MQPLCSYLICTTPYSGSTLLCEALKHTGSAGRPEEYFAVMKSRTIQAPLLAYSHSSGEPLHDETLSPTDYLTQVFEASTSSNGVFGATVMWSYFDDFICSLRRIAAYREMAIPDLLPTVFPNLHYIWVTRRNKVQQAVSLWKTLQRQTWEQDENLLPPKRNIALHFQTIDRLAQQIVADEVDWWRFFDACAIQPFTVIYEEMVEDVGSAVEDVLGYLQLPTISYMLSSV